MIITPQNTLPTQYEFATVNPIEFKHPAIIGGFGSGKTASIGLRWLNLINWRAKEQSIRTKMMIIEPTVEMIRDVLVPELDRFFSLCGIKHKYHKSYKNYEITFKDHKFIAMLRSSDVPESLTGKTVTDIIIDEFDKKHSIPHQRDVWKECLGRIRGTDYATCSIVTTPEGFKYTYELYGECDYKDKKNFKLIRAKTYDNHFLPADYVQNLYDQYSEELVKQYIEAEFINLTQGKVYYAFDREKNNTDKVYNKNLDINLMVDFNVNPMKWIIGQNEYDKDYIIDEIVQQNTYTEKMALEVANRYGKDTHYNIYGDYSGNYGSTKSKATDYDIIKSILPNSTTFLKNNPLVIDRVNAVNSRLRNSKGENRLFINFNKCPHLVKDFEQVIWSESKREIDKTTNKDLTHASDGLGYYIEFRYSLKKNRGNTKIGVYA